MTVDKERKEKIFLLRELADSAGWKMVMVPWIQEQIRRISNLGNMKTGDDEEVIKEFRKRKIKMDVYRGVLNKPEDLIKELEKGGKLNGRETSNT